MLNFGRIGRTFHSRTRVVAWMAWGFAITVIVTGKTHAQLPPACDSTPYFSGGPIASEAALCAIPESKALFECDPLDALCGESPFLCGDGSAWIEYIAGDGPGWEGYTGLGGSLPFRMANGVLMLEGQGLVTRSGNGSGSVGVHRRFFVGRALVGAGLWYDVTQSPNENVFHQTSISLEWFPLDHWSFRSNGYLPIGTRTENLALNPVVANPSISFGGNNLFATTVVANRVDEVAMRGYEFEIARNILSWAGEAFIGYYNYHGDVGGSTDGLKAGLRGYVTPRLAGNVTIASDPDFGTNFFGGLTWHFGGCGGRVPRSLCDKLTIPVERNPQIVTDQPRTPIIEREILTNPDTNQPITIAHVRSQSGGRRLGTFENPFVGLPPTQTTDIVYVHAGSVFDNQTYVMNEDQMLLGEGSGYVHLVDTVEHMMVPLPGASGAPNRPVIQNTPVAVQAADNTLISNFRIVNAGVGILADDVAGTVDIERLLIEDGGTAVGIDNSTGAFSISETTITDPNTTAFRLLTSNSTVNSASLLVGGDTTINQAADGSILIVSDHTTGTIEFTADSTINATNGTGLIFSDADGTYTFDGEVNLTGGLAGIAIFDDSEGTFDFGSDTLITTNTAGRAFVIDELGANAQIDFDGSIIRGNGGGDLVFIDGTAATSVINFNSTGSNMISGNGAGGIVIVNANGDVAFTTAVSIQDPVNAEFLTGIGIGDGDGDISFADVSVDLPDDGLNAGVGINGHDGRITFDQLDIVTNGAGTIGLVVTQSNDVTIGGTSTVTTTGGPAIELLDVGTIDMTFSDISVTNSMDGNGLGNGLFMRSIGAGTFDVTGTTTVNGANGVQPAFYNGAGIYIDASSATFTFNDIDISDTMTEGVAIGTGTVVGNPGMVIINGGSISDTGGNGVTVENAGFFELNDTLFTNTGGFTISLTGSTVDGDGNATDPPAAFSSDDGGGNSGMILFNGGADSAP